MPLTFRAGAFEGFDTSPVKQTKQMDMQVALNIINVRRPKRSTVIEQVAEPRMIQNWEAAARICASRVGIPRSETKMEEA